MDPVSSATISNASSADPGTVQGAAAMSVLKQALNLQAASALQLIQALPQAQLATSGQLGTRLDAYA
ncbi:MAG: putative motility protein [Ideonella sp.]|jgi:hypothetical protein|nr:putative motility protein [Ideonella sp.]MBL0148602.1 putative motility protein [Ideonella sp.]